jgi:hypothetical protein
MIMNARGGYRLLIWFSFARCRPLFREPYCSCCGAYREPALLDGLKPL